MPGKLLFRGFFCFFCGFIVTDDVFRFRYGLIFALFGGAVVFYGADFFLVVMRGAGHGNNLAALVDLHHANALAGTCTDANGTGFDADNHTVICDENDVVIEINDLNGRDIAVFFNVVVEDTHAAAMLQAVILGVR